MTQRNELTHTVFSRLLLKRAFRGAGIALVLLAVFLTVAGVITDGVWVFLAMLTVSVGGACGGAFYHLASLLPVQSGWQKRLINIACLLVYLAGLWLSLIVALAAVGLWD